MRNVFRLKNLGLVLLAIYVLSSGAGSFSLCPVKAARRAAASAGITDGRIARASAAEFSFAAAGTDASPANTFCALAARLLAREALPSRGSTESPVSGSLAAAGPLSAARLAAVSTGPVSRLLKSPRSGPRLDHLRTIVLLI